VITLRDLSVWSSLQIKSCFVIMQHRLVERAAQGPVVISQSQMTRETTEERPANDRQTTRSKTMEKIMERETTSARRISAPDPRHMTAFSICGHMAGVAASFAGDLVRPLGSPDHQIRSSETSVSVWLHHT